MSQQLEEESESFLLGDVLHWNFKLVSSDGNLTCRATRKTDGYLLGLVMAEVLTSGMVTGAQLVGM